MTNDPSEYRYAPMDELPDEVLEEAAIWQARLRDAAAGAVAGRQVRAEFGRWLLRDTRHRQAFAEMEALWGALEEPVEQWLAELETGARSRASRWSSLAMIACLLLAAFLGVGWQQDWLAQWQGDYVTAVGETAAIELEDGSRIALNTDSALAIDFGSEVRRVRLIQGEAWFNVSSADPRPFIVVTDPGSVTVTGTRFNVRLAGEVAIASLDEGQVVLRAADVAEDKPVALAPGWQSVLASDGISPPELFDRTEITAWRRGQAVFYNTPLAAVVATLNRYRPGRIVVVGETLNQLRVSGVFAVDDPDAALNVIANTLPIQQTRLTDYLVLIR